MSHNDCNQVGEIQAGAPTCLESVGLHTSHILASVTCTQSRAPLSPQLYGPSCFSSASPLSPPEPREEKAEAWEGRARALSHLTRHSNSSSSSTGRWAGQGKAGEHDVHMALVSGDGGRGRDGTGAGTRPDRRHVRQSVSHHFVKS